MPGIVLYARVDGSFSVWDPARNYWRQWKARDDDNPDRPDAYHFDRQQVWNGLSTEDGTPICEGLLRDWVSWQRSSKADETKDTDPFAILTEALDGLSADPAERLKPGKLTRVLGGGARDYPTLETYGTVPVHLASAGIRRITALAYLVVWTWYEHVQASKLLGNEPEDRFLILWDEVETHLHPRWQRAILPALLKVIQRLRSDASMRVQVLATTHSPLVLASLEPAFDPDEDALHLLDLDNGRVALERQAWSSRGDALN
ncbi:MAG: AAA family ATPase [Myxococcota bacterium]